MLKKRLNTYRQHIRQPRLKQKDVEGHIRTCDSGKFKTMSLFASREDSKIFRESFETYFIQKLKPKLNKRPVNKSKCSFHCLKCRNFLLFPSVEIFSWRTVSADFWSESPEELRKLLVCGGFPH